MPLEPLSEMIKRLAGVADQTWLTEMQPTDFEFLVASLFEGLGYRAELTPQTKDGGRDILVSKTVDLAEISGAIECKKWSRMVGVDPVRQLLFVTERDRATWGAIVSTSGFTRSALELAAQYRHRLRLLGPAELRGLAQRVVAGWQSEAAELIYRVRHLRLSELGRLELPDSGSILTQGTVDRLELPPSYRASLASAHTLPLQAIDLILRDPRLVRALSPREFERFIAEIIDSLGFSDVVLTPRSGDGGKDVIASKLVEGIPLSFYFECKQYAEGNKVQLDTLRSLLGTVAHDSRKANIGVLVTTSSFTQGSRRLIAAECRLDGKDYDGLLGWIRRYEQLLERQS